MHELSDSLRSEHLFDAEIDLEPAEDVGETSFGRRTIHVVRRGTLSGPKIRGQFRPGGGDWLLSFAGGYNELDVRASFETDDGAHVYLSYRGVLKIDPEMARRVVGGEDVSPAEYCFRTTPRFETGSEKYAWLNTTVCVGYGWFGRHKVGYRVFAVL